MASQRILLRNLNTCRLDLIAKSRNQRTESDHDDVQGDDIGFTAHESKNQDARLLVRLASTIISVSVRTRAASAAQLVGGARIINGNPAPDLALPYSENIDVTISPAAVS
jgi:hypothetical protein